ncbi:dihydrodipicolinate synthase family protein [Algoriphagus aestuariicola]|uniref:Dihydrodipicolinate synthase family protein n=1 Tax=Algoriphagus aestuariicola TaxID=1852016 RepID=A0ABS3BMS0_9BACT|nr:dihydrodipicolinate synthase family protein [Algoriphagus aestuariicola]MBN7799536.1 dihydrodipicolinate synthase family protein [Algoriphagus aestuariicola]
MNPIDIFQGIFPPMITPLNPDFSLDVAHTEKLIEYLIDGGVHGIFIIGTTGESASISMDVKNDLIRLTCKKVAGRVPVLVGITESSFVQSLDLAAVALESGASALVAATPFYINIDQDEVVNYYQKLADAVKLPLFLYDMPSHTKVKIEIESAVKLSEHPNIIGLKDSTGNKDNFKALCDAFKNQPDFRLFIGPEEILAESLEMGGHGGVCGGGNLFPKLYVSLFEAFQKQEDEKVQNLQETILFLSENIYQNGTYKSSYLKGLKASLSFEDLCDGTLALPLYSYSEEEQYALRDRFSAVKDRVEQALLAAI